MSKTMMVAAIAAVMLCACGKGGGSADCGPFTVTLDGKPIAGLKFGYGTKDQAGYTVTMVNHDKWTCDDILKGMLPTQEGEQHVRVSAGGQFGGGISYDANTRMGTKVAVSMKTTPTKAGDPIGICVSGTIDLNIGDHKGSKVAIKGLAEGTYCGETK